VCANSTLPRLRPVPGDSRDFRGRCLRRVRPAVRPRSRGRLRPARLYHGQAEIPDRAVDPRFRARRQHGAGAAPVAHDVAGRPCYNNRCPVRRNAMLRREFLAGSACLVAAGATTPAFAQFRPTRPVEFVVHGGPGSGNDVFARALIAIIDQEKFAPVRFQVVNKPGGGSTAAAAYIASKRADPHVIGCWTNIWLPDPLMQETATNGLLTLTPIVRLAIEPALVVVRTDSPIKSMDDFIKLAKEKPGALKMSGGSIASRENIVRQLIMKVTGARWAFNSLPSGGERIAALLGGHLEMMSVDPSEAG